MIPEFVRAIREVSPLAFMLENVRGLARPAFAEYFEYILLQLQFPSVEPGPGETQTQHRDRLRTKKLTARADYMVTWALVNAANFGVPQIRWRVIVVGLRADRFERPFDFPDPTHSRNALLTEQWVTGDYWRRHALRQRRLPPDLAGTIPRLVQAGREENLMPWRTVRDAIGHLPEPKSEPNFFTANHWLQPGARSYPGHSGSSWDMPAKTLKAGVHGVPGGENMLLKENGAVRYFTVHETALLQTFPPRWVFSGPWGETMRQLGNAMPVQLAETVSLAIAKRINARYQTVSPP
jgi:DNA (cytosine-5)-methyltransferase 1